MFILILIAVLCLFGFAYDLMDVRRKADLHDTRKTYARVKEAKEDMISFIYCNRRVDYYRRIYTWLYYNNKTMYDWVVQNPDYIRNCWLVQPSEMFVDDTLKYETNRDAVHLVKSWYRSGKQSGEFYSLSNEKPFKQWFTHV